MQLKYLLLIFAFTIVSARASAVRRQEVFKRDAEAEPQRGYKRDADAQPQRSHKRDADAESQYYKREAEPQDYPL